MQNCQLSWVQKKQSWDTNYVESPLSWGCRGRQVTFSWGPKSEKWPINPVKSIPGKGNNTLEAWLWFSTKPMARTRRVEWSRVQEEIRKRNRQIVKGFSAKKLGIYSQGFSAKKLGIYSQGNGKPLETYKTRVTWLYFFLNPEQLYEEKLWEVER